MAKANSDEAIDEQKAKEIQKQLKKMKDQMGKNEALEKKAAAILKQSEKSS
jgi:hypothetical protein